MSWFSALVVFFISWWMVFLGSLSIGVKGQFENNDTVEGTEPGAPVDHMLPKKALWATIGAAIVTIIAFIIVMSGIIKPPEPPWAKG